MITTALWWVERHLTASEQCRKVLDMERALKHLGAKIGFFCVAHLEPETAASSPCPVLSLRVGFRSTSPAGFDVTRREPFRAFISVSSFLPDRDG